MPTPQDPTYASPATSGQLRRSRYLSEAIRQMGERTKDVYNSALGTNASILTDAILGYARNKADKRADEGLKADRTRLADAVLGGLPDMPTAAQAQAATQQQLGAASPFDLTPAGVEKRNTTGGLQTQARGIFDSTGDIGAALQFGLGQQRQKIEDSRYEQERKDKLREPFNVSNGATAINDPDGDGVYEEIFNNPDPSAVAPGQSVQSTLIGDDRTPYVIMRDGSHRALPFKAQDNYTIADIGGVPTPISGRTGTPGAPLTTPQQVGENAAAIAEIKDKGAASTQAKIDLPQAIANAKYSIGVMDALSAHEGFPKRYGWEGLPGTVGIMEPGSPAADAQALLDQVTGQAFLTGIQALRGTGPLSEREGAAATAAVTRLKDNRQSPKAAAQALTELRTHVDNLRLLAMVKAGAPINPQNLTPAQLDLVQEMLEASQ